MSKAFIDDVTLTSIADAIRDTNGSSNAYLPSEMPAAISALAPDQEQLVINPSELSQTFKSTNGYANILAKPVSSTYIGSDVTRKVAASYTPTKETQTISSGQYLTGDQTINPIPDEYIIPNLDVANVGSTDYTTKTILPGTGYDGFSKIILSGIPEDYIIPSGTKDIPENGNSIDVKNYQYVNVNVPVPSGYYKLQTYHGTYTPANDTKDKSFTFDFVPKGVAIISITSIARAATYSYIASWVWMGEADKVQVVNYVINTDHTDGLNGVTQGSGTGSFPTTLSGKTFTFKLSATTTTGYNFRFKAGAVYHIYAWGY